MRSNVHKEIDVVMTDAAELVDVEHVLRQVLHQYVLQT
jgi:hypothetical protein